MACKINTRSIEGGIHLQTISPRVRIGRIIFFVFAIIFALSVATQFLLAGMAIFISPVNWMKHVTFVHLFGFNVPIFMLVSAWIGALPLWTYLQILGIFALMFLMYFSANITAVLPWFGAMHPVFGLLLLALSCMMKWNVWKLTFGNKYKQQGEG